MLDFGFSKLAIIGALALIVVGPEKLPTVARTAGRWWGKAQRALADIKGEINHSIALDELKAMQADIEAEARDIGHSLSTSAEELRRALAGEAEADTAPPQYRHPNKNWRTKRTALPYWYKTSHGTRRYVQSGAARVARFRPKNYRR